MKDLWPKVQAQTWQTQCGKGNVLQFALKCRILTGFVHEMPKTYRIQQISLQILYPSNWMPVDTSLGQILF